MSTMAELTPTASGIAAEHADIIEGLVGVLVEVGYVQNTDIQVPPHGPPKDPIDMAGLRQSGLDARTIELIGRLPCFTNDIIHEQQQITGSQDGIPIAPASAATSYLLGTDLPEGFRNTGSEELLPTSAFQITKATGQHGMNLAYDLDTRTIIKWTRNEWSNRQQIQVSSFFERWTQQLRQRRWQPRKSSSGWHIDQEFTSDIRRHAPLVESVLMK